MCEIINFLRGKKKLNGIFLFVKSFALQLIIFCSHFKNVPDVYSSMCYNFADFVTGVKNYLKLF